MVCENYNCEPPSFTERILQKSAPESQSQELKKCLNLFDLTVQGPLKYVYLCIILNSTGNIILKATLRLYRTEATHRVSKDCSLVNDRMTYSEPGHLYVRSKVGGRWCVV